MELTQLVSVSVIVPVLDAEAFIDVQLSALAAQEYSGQWEVVIADNGSVDTSLSRAQRYAHFDRRFKVIDASARRGPGAARNAGAREAKGELLAFCDADDQVQPGWISAWAQAAGGSKGSPPADAMAGWFYFGALGAAPGGTSELQALPASMKHMGFLPAGLGANLCVRRKAFWAIGGFGEDLRAGEDIDFCWRLQLAGFNLAPVPDAVVAKRERKSPREMFSRAFTYGECGPELYRRFRSAGMQRDYWLAAKSWAWMAVMLPTLVSVRNRHRWARAAGERLGRLRGSLRNRVFFF